MAQLFGYMNLKGGPPDYLSRFKSDFHPEIDYKDDTTALFYKTGIQKEKKTFYLKTRNCM